MGLIMKIVVFIVNIILWAAGIVMLVLGAIAVGSPVTMINALNNIPGVSNVSILINIYPLFNGVAIFMIVVGSVVFLFGFVGCHGAFRMHKRSIMIYWILLLAGVGGEIALIIYSAIFPGTMNTYIQTSLNESFNTAFQPVKIDPNGTIAYSSLPSASSWEYLQAEAHCCGVAGPVDYDYNPVWQQVANGSRLPPTCCMSIPSLGNNAPTNSSDFVNLPACQSESNSFYQQGCMDNVENMVYQFDLISIITSSCLIAAQLVALFFTIHTWHKMVREEGF